MKKEEIKKLLFNFWQSSSDICPLELSKAEEQERLFEEYIENTYTPKHELVLFSKDWERLIEKSSYNHNFYKYIGKEWKNATEILEICNEDYDYYKYYLIESGAEIFLGCSEKVSLKNSNGFVEIDFRMHYT